MSGSELGFDDAPLLQLYEEAAKFNASIEPGQLIEDLSVEVGQSASSRDELYGRITSALIRFDQHDIRSLSDAFPEVGEHGLGLTRSIDSIEVVAEEEIVLASLLPIHFEITNVRRFTQYLGAVGTHGVHASPARFGLFCDVAETLAVQIDEYTRRQSFFATIDVPQARRVVAKERARAIRLARAIAPAYNEAGLFLTTPFRRLIDHAMEG